MVLERLPTVKKCCCIVPLTWGAVLIAVFYIVCSVADHKVTMKRSPCYAGVCKSNCKFNYVMDYFSYIYTLDIVLNFVLSSLLIVGVFVESREIVTVYLYFIIITVVLITVMNAIILTVGLTQANCGNTPIMRAICIVEEILFICLFIYFTIVVNSLRMILPREVDIRASQDTMVVNNFTRFLMDEELYPDPMEFKPERFIVDGAIKLPDHYFPFGLGKHRCLGDVLSKCNIFIFTTTILQKFTFLPLDGEMPSLRHVDGATASAAPFKARIVPRNLNL